VISLAHLAVFWTAGLLTGTLLGAVLGGEAPVRAPQQHRAVPQGAERRSS
jgi:hypothetical protein